MPQRRCAPTVSGWMSSLVSDRHMQLRPCIAVFQSFLACVWRCIDFAMSSPISLSTCAILFATFVIMSSRFVFDCVFIAQLVLWYFSFEGLHGLGLGGPNGGPGCRPPSRSKSRGHYCHCPLWCFRYLVCNRGHS